MKLIHYTKQPLYKVVTVKQPDYSMKPQGLWVSVEGPDDWKAFCQTTTIFDDSFEHTYEVKLKDDANILRLSSPEDIDAFEAEWIKPDPDYQKAGLGRGHQIDWQGVAAKYQGIIITPYIWPRRFSAGVWYYGWDCASGCIWNAAAIASVEEVDQEETPYAKEAEAG